MEIRSAVRTVRATKAVRKMKGCCQSHLLQADDGCCYVVKFANNPQFGRRALFNEYIAATLFRALGVTTPDSVLVDISAGFIADDPNVCFLERSEKHPVSPGIHFGSAYTEWPLVYDFLPDTLINAVANSSEFFGALVLDKWLGNTDGRQTIFYRSVDDRRRTSQTRWVVSMIDHGSVFGGDAWRFEESAPQGLYGRRCVYGTNPLIGNFAPWIDRLMRLDRSLLSSALSQVPGSWLKGDEKAAEMLLDRLWARRTWVESLVLDAIEWAAIEGRPARGIQIRRQRS